MVRLVKRYGSRKLYDTEESRYVSLDEIREWIRRGQEVRVIDNDTDDDVTAPTLTQVILEDSRRGASPPSALLHELIRRGGELVTTGVEQLQHGVDRLLNASVERLAPLRQAREETAVLRRRLEELEASLRKLETESPAPRPAAPARRRKTTPRPATSRSRTAPKTVSKTESKTENPASTGER